MKVDVAGLGNAIMDALVVAENGDALLDELGLVRGTMHGVDHKGWTEVYDRVVDLGVTLDSGGSCANTIATLGRLGAHVSYCGQVGDDELGRTYTRRMHEATGSHAIRVNSAGATGKCLSIISREDAERTMVTDLGISTALSDLGDFTEVLDNARIGHFTGYTLLDGPMRPLVLAAMQRVRRAGGLVSLDVADPFVVSAIRPVLWKTIDELADIVFLNAEEARALTDLAPEHAGQAVAEQANVQTVVVKLGSKGSLVVDRGTEHRIEIERVVPVDTTGAGDAYAGGFLYGRIRGWSAEASGRLGSSVAAATVGQLGAVVRDNDRLAQLVARIAPRAA